MIRTNDAVAAMLFMVHARRLGLDPVALGGGEYGGDFWELETRSAEIGMGLWWLLEMEFCEPRKVTLHDIQQELEYRAQRAQEPARTFGDLEKEGLVSGVSRPGPTRLRRMFPLRHGD